LSIQNLAGQEPCQHPRCLCTVGSTGTRRWSQFELGSLAPLRKCWR